MDFREQLPIEKGFASVFAGQIRPELQKLETYRLAKRKKGKTTLLLSLAIGAVISVIVYLAADGDVFGLVAIGVIMIISLITGLFLQAKQAKKWTGAVSGVVMPAICDFLGDTTYDQAAQRGFQTRKMHELGLVGHYDTSKLEDHIEGIYSGVPYELVEAKLTTENRDIDSNTQTNVVFRGLLFRIELPQPAPCSILITRDYGKVLNKVAGFFSGKKGRGMARIETGHAEFESHFELHADFAQATLDYLPQAFLDNLMQIATTAADGGPEQMRIAFEGRDCWLAIGRKRDFLKMPPINKPVETIVDELHYVFEDLSLVRHIIDQLKA